MQHSLVSVAGEYWVSTEMETSHLTLNFISVMSWGLTKAFIFSIHVIQTCTATTITTSKCLCEAL